MTPETIALLNVEDATDPFHDELLQYVRGLVKMSRSSMSKYYEEWDHQELIFRGERAADKEDRDSARKGKPVKMVVPSTYAQVMTFTSFLFLMYNQNAKFYELMPTGNEDYGKKQADSEAMLARDLGRNSWNTKLFQHLLDVSRFGTGILETAWTQDTVKVKVPEQLAPVTVEGITMTPSADPTWQEFVRYEGNLIRNVSPYRFFPDTRHPLVDFQKGEFCAIEEEYSVSQLKKMEASGEVTAVDFIPALPANLDMVRGGPTRSALVTDEKRMKDFDASNASHVAIVTKVQVWLVPSRFKVEGKAIGDEDHPVLFHVWYANDQRLIRVEPAGWWHNEFGFTVAQFTPDQHREVTMGLGDLVCALQDTISWLINSHISSVRRVMQNRLIVDPKLVDTKSLDGEGDIYLKKGVSIPLDRAVGQLRVQDVTGGHMNDAEVLSKVMEMITGVNGNAMGQYNSGRRSAQEARVVTAGAAGRMKLHAHLIWDSSLGRLGRLMLSNLRQQVSEKSFARVIGQAADLPMRYAAFKGTPEEVICGDDYFVFDSTLASEKGFMAQSLQELLIALMSNPMLAQQWDLSPKAMMEEIQRLRGAGDITRFSLSKRVQQGLEAPPPPAIVEPQPGVAA